MIVNGHGGNYVLSNVVQESNVGKRTMVLFPRSEDWIGARRAAGVITSNHEDMHGGEAGTSILLATSAEVVRPSYRNADLPSAAAAACSPSVCVPTPGQGSSVDPRWRPLVRDGFYSNHFQCGWWCDRRPCVGAPPCGWCGKHF